MVRSILSERSTTTVETTAPQGRGYSLVRWGPSFAGAISAIALTTMGMALWWAIGYGSRVMYIRTNLPWFFLGTVLGALLLGGMLAGRVAGVRTAGVRASDGLTVWGLAVIAALIPLTIHGPQLADRGVASAARSTAFHVSSGNTWALFGAVAGGLLCAVFGALVGGAGTRRTMVFAARETRPVTSAPGAPASPPQHRAG